MSGRSEFVLKCNCGGLWRLNTWLAIGWSKINMGINENMKISTSAYYMKENSLDWSVRIPLGCIIWPDHGWYDKAFQLLCPCHSKNWIEYVLQTHSLTPSSLLRWAWVCTLRHNSSTSSVRTSLLNTNVLPCAVGWGCQVCTLGVLFSASQLHKHRRTNSSHLWHWRGLYTYSAAELRLYTR